MDRDAVIEEIKVAWPMIWKSFVTKKDQYGHDVFDIIEDDTIASPYWVVNKKEAFIRIPPDYYERNKIK